MSLVSFENTKEWEWIISVIGINLQHVDELIPHAHRDPHHIQLAIEQCDMDWASLRCLFTIASFSYLDSKISENASVVSNQATYLSLSLFFDRLDYMPSGELLWRGDEIHHRRVATYIRLKPTGDIYLTTYQRGLSARFWIHQLRGNKMMSLVNASS